MAFSFDDLKSRGDDRNDGMDDFTEEMGEAAAELHPRATATTIVRDDSGTLCFGEEVECRSEPCHEVLLAQDELKPIREPNTINNKVNDSLKVKFCSCTRSGLALA